MYASVLYVVYTVRNEDAIRLISASKSNTVKQTLDLKNPPPVTDAQKAWLATVAAMLDEQTDYSDAPHLPDAVWTKAVELPGAKQQ